MKSIEKNCLQGLKRQNKLLANMTCVKKKLFAFRNKNVCRGAEIKKQVCRGSHCSGMTITASGPGVITQTHST